MFGKQHERGWTFRSHVPFILGQARPILKNIQKSRSMKRLKNPQNRTGRTVGKNFAFLREGMCTHVRASTLCARRKLSDHQSPEKVGGTQPIDTRRFRQGTSDPKPHLIHQGFLGYIFAMGEATGSKLSMRKQGELVRAEMNEENVVVDLYPAQ